MRSGRQREEAEERRSLFVGYWALASGPRAKSGSSRILFRKNRINCGLVWCDSPYFSLRLCSWRRETTRGRGGVTGFDFVLLCCIIHFKRRGETKGDEKRRGKLNINFYCLLFRSLPSKSRCRNSTRYCFLSLPSSPLPIRVLEHSVSRKDFFS